MTTEELVDDALREITCSFAADAASHHHIQRILDQFPNITPHEVWDALPMLFWRGVLNSAELRSIPYVDFLQTQYWRAVSEHLKTEYPWCALCTEPLAGPLEVHHRTYKHRGSEWEHLEDLAVLCHECHDWISKKPSRWKSL